MTNHHYLCIDLKSFYASVECVERGLDPMTTNLVVADMERTEKTICLAVSPSLRALGVHNRCRVFEIPKNIPYIAAEPRMQKYIDYAGEIYGLYLRYIAPEDIHVYSIDEAFLDVTPYLSLYGKTPKEIGIMLMEKIAGEIGVRATCGVGTNLYLAKIALDITAKHAKDFVGCLDEAAYCRTLWDHRPLVDFWRIGAGTAKRLEKYGITTMGQIAHTNEDFLYDLFGIDAELLIDHAWGRESATIADIKSYQPKTNCLSSGQVLMRDYSFEEGKVIVKEMMDALCLDMVEKNVVTESITLRVGYSNSLHFESAKGSTALDFPASADRLWVPAAADLYERIVAADKAIRRVSVTCNNITADTGVHQLSLFDTGETQRELERNGKLQKAVIGIKKKYGKNAVLKALDLKDEATAKQRNRQIGGHKSGK